MTTDESVVRGWRIGALEIATAFVVAALFVWACTTIKVNSLVRMGQVSGIATVELRLLWFGVPLVLALVAAAKWRDGRAFPIVSRLVCAALAGLSSAAIAGGILAALYRSPYGLGGLGGDSGILINWAELVKRGVVVSPIYPPLQTQLLAWLSDVLGMPTQYAMKWFQVIGIAAVGPLCYSTWRLLLRPSWALSVGIIASLPLVEAYRQYPLLVCIVLVPVLVKFLDVLRRSHEFSFGSIVQHAVLLGMALGTLFLLYSGWFQWSAPGFLVAAVIVFPWRHRWGKGLFLCALAVVVFGLFTYQYLTAVIESPPIKDDYVYFDATIEPAYIAMWRGGLPGNVGVWPPMGELAGVGLFSVLLAVGLGIAVAFGRSHTIVIGVVSIMIGTWLFRFWHAHNMYSTKLVQLYPRTTAELLYCALILALFGVCLVIERARTRALADSPLRTPWGLIGGCAAFVALLVSTTGATTDKYMPKDRFDEPGHMAWLANKTPLLGESQTLDASIEASSSYNEKGYSVAALLDRRPATAFSSALGKTEDHEESLTIQLPMPREFSSIVLTPAADGFPVEVVVELWDGEKWLPRIQHKYVQQPTGKQTLSFSQMEGTNRIRLRATKLRVVDGSYVLRLAEIELFR